MTEYIIAEKSQRSPHEKPWWWLKGETYQHRHLLKQQGARFSGKRREWYFVGWELPAAIRQLLAPEQEAAPASVETDGVYPLAASAETALVINPKPDEQLRDHTDEPISTPSLAVFTQINSDEPASLIATAAGIRIVKPSSTPPDGDPLDAVQNAILEAKSLPPTPQLESQPVRNGRLLHIRQSYCGELTGSITGQVFCYGYAIHDGVCVYINMGGPRTSVEAIRAKLGKGDIVTLVPDDAPAIELTAGEGSSGMYTDCLQTIPEARFTSLILLHEWVIHPSDEAKATFILQVDGAQAKAKLKHLVTQLVNVPVFDVWTEFLWSAGRAASLVRPTRPAGGIDLMTLSLDAPAWTRLITSGVEQQVIQLPEIQ